MEKLKILSDLELETRLKHLVQRERQLLHVILEHIKELDTRKLYLDRAYPSLYEYLTKELGYSGSAAMRRIEAARLLREVPVLAEKIQEGSLNLSQIGELSRSIKEKEGATGIKITSCEKQELVARITGKTTQETQKDLAQALDLPIKDFEKQKVQKDESVQLELTLTKEQHQKLLQCRDLAAHLLQQNQSDSSWASVFEVLADQFLAKKNGHRLEANRRDVETSAKNQFEEGKRITPSSTTASVVRRTNTTLTPKTRRGILKRDGCCQFKDSKTGRMCGSTYSLQIDHRKSQWAGGGHDPDNLQVLCGRHNRQKYHEEIHLKFKNL